MVAANPIRRSRCPLQLGAYTVNGRWSLKENVVSEFRYGAQRDTRPPFRTLHSPDKAHHKKAGRGLRRGTLRDFQFPEQSDLPSSVKLQCRTPVLILVIPTQQSEIPAGIPTP